MTKGAGTGAGLKDTVGSQGGAGESVVGGQSSGTATAGSGTASITASSSSSSSTKNSAPSLQPLDKTPLIIGMIVTSFTLFGAVLL
jgi:hypothetical protein